jgi:hypothetical protein
MLSTTKKSPKFQRRLKFDVGDVVGDDVGAKDPGVGGDNVGADVGNAVGAVGNGVGANVGDKVAKMAASTPPTYSTRAV